jgi:3-dehydroquinate synthase
MTATENRAVRVELETRSYDIVIGSGLIDDAAPYLGPVLESRKRVVIISDETVAAFYLGPLSAALDRSGLAHQAITVPAGEGSKSWEILTSVIDRLTALKVDRRTVILALGGGVVGDLAGFVAAITLRGLDFIQIPTSLLAQVDSSVGGKTGINVAAGKNLVGAFHQPLLVLADLDTLKTLPPRELRSGYAEIVKHAAIADAAFFDVLCQGGGAAVISGDQSAQALAVRHSCETKATIVAEDELESGRRALLNFGHTFGHALEAETGYGDRLRHGEGVAVGMVLAAALSAKLGLCPVSAGQRLATHLEQVGLPSSLKHVPGAPFAPDRLVEHMMVDKKNRDGALTFIVLRDLGQAEIRHGVDAHIVRDLLVEMS